MDNSTTANWWLDCTETPSVDTPGQDPVTLENNFYIGPFPYVHGYHYYTDNSPRNEGLNQTYSETGFPVTTRADAIERLIWATAYWIPVVDEWGVIPAAYSFKTYMKTLWKQLGIIPWDTNTDGD